MEVIDLGEREQALLARVRLYPLGMKFAALAGGANPTDFEVLTQEPDRARVSLGIKNILAPGETRSRFQNGLSTTGVKLVGLYNQLPAGLLNTAASPAVDPALAVQSLDRSLEMAQGKRNLVLEYMRGGHIVGNIAYRKRVNQVSDFGFYPGFGGDDDTESRHLPQSYLYGAMLMSDYADTSLRLVSKLFLAEKLQTATVPERKGIADEAWFIANGVPTTQHAAFLETLVSTGKHGRAEVCSGNDFDMRLVRAGISRHDRDWNNLLMMHSAVSQTAGVYNNLLGSK